MSRQHDSAERQRHHAQGQRNIRRRCTCERIITGNVAWWSHTHTKDGEPREGHRFAGRA